MKKIIAALMVLAMVLTMAPAVFAAETALADSIPVKSGTESISETGAIEFNYTPDADGILTVTLSADTGYRITVTNVVTEEADLPISGTSGTHEYALEAGVQYQVYIIGYKNWGEAAATITYDAAFTPEELEIPPVEIEKSEVTLELGANTVDLLENTIVSLYQFVPSEPGIYTITAEGADVATYGFALWNLLTEGVNGVVEHTATAAEQTVLIGVTAETASVTVTVEKTGSYTPPEQTVYEEYVPTNTLVSDFEDPTDLVNVDINKEQNVVLGSDGYYHLGTAAGPVIYVKLNNEQVTLATLGTVGAITTLRGIYVDEEGQEHPYDFLNMIMAEDSYRDYSYDYDYHPLNKDLMVFLKAYGQSQGWYDADKSYFTAIQNGEFVEESAWLASCYSTVSYVEPGAPEEIVPEEPEVETKVEITEGGITEVPESLKEAGLETAEKVKEALVEAITEKNEKIDGKNIAHYDVALMYTEDGTTWIKADDTHFPADGKIKVTIPYPEGTDSSYKFTVVHMFTSNAFGKTPGAVELPEVTNTEKGIEFEVTGLSPITVGWEAKAETPATGDNSNLVLMFALMLVSACGMFAIVSKEKHAR